MRFSFVRTCSRRTEEICAEVSPVSKIAFLTQLMKFITEALSNVTEPSLFTAYSKCDKFSRCSEDQVKKSKTLS